VKAPIVVNITTNIGGDGKGGGGKGGGGKGVRGHRGGAKKEERDAWYRPGGRGNPYPAASWKEIFTGIALHVCLVCLACLPCICVCPYTYLSYTYLCI
jgi:hypothetical protein